MKEPLSFHKKLVHCMYVFRIALIGDGAVGKTAIRRRYMGEGFTVNYQATIGADFSIKKILLDEIEVQFQIWDLAGQPLYNSVRKTYYNGCMGGLAVYDCSRRSTYDNILNWTNELWTHCGRGKIPVVLLGNKSDLMSQNSSPVILTEGEELAKQISFQTQLSEFPVHFFPSSAKTGQNIEIAFNCLGKAILDFF
ncbi:MAG: Rab family GTPase, partial [Candidatus Hodarchaeota archaeon]